MEAFAVAPVVRLPGSSVPVSSPATRPLASRFLGSVHGVIRPKPRSLARCFVPAFKFEASSAPSASSVPREEDTRTAQIDLQSALKALSRVATRNAVPPPKSLHMLQRLVQELEPAVLPMTANPSTLPEEIVEKMLGYEKPQQMGVRPLVTRNDGNDDEDNNYLINIGEVLHGRYIVNQKINKGAYGQVVKALDTHTQEEVAIKIIKNHEAYARAARMEISILNRLNYYDPTGCFHSVLLKEHFIHRNHMCLVFELLSYNLHDVMRATQYTGLPLSAVRNIAWQVLKCLAFLSLPEVSVLHCDLKPENVLLRTPDSTSCTVADFGSSCLVQVAERETPRKRKRRHYIQSRYYRSPEVLLGLETQSRIDLWSLGCILVELHSGVPLFPGRNEFDQMHRICEVLGLPPNHLIDQSPHAEKFFEISAGLRYKLREFPVDVNGIASAHDESSAMKTAPASRSLRSVLGVESLGPNPVQRGAPGHTLFDYLLFEDLISRMLHFDPAKRCTPFEALQHMFFRHSSVQQATGAEGTAEGAYSAILRDAKLSV
eukprot:tig00001229_g7855.t1